MANYNIEEVQKIVDILINADAVMCVSNFAPQKMLDICDTCAFEDACPSAHFNKTESSVCAFYKSLQKDKPDGTYWREALKDD